MNSGDIATWAGVAVSLVISTLAWLQSKSAQKDTRAYKDAVFVLEWEPFEVDTSADPMADQGQLALKLINKGETSARKVRLTADFDPFGLVVPIGEWPYIAGGGSAVRHGTTIMYTAMGAGRLPNFQDGDESTLASVEFVSQTGHKARQKVPIPQPSEFSIHKNFQIRQQEQAPEA